MEALKVSLRFAGVAEATLEDNHIIAPYIEQIASNVYEIHPEEDGFFDEEQIESEITEALTEAGVPEDEFWFD